MSLVKDSRINWEETEAENESYNAFKKELSQIGKITEVDTLETDMAGSLP